MKKITFDSFLSGAMARDYILDDTPYVEQIEKAKDILNASKHVLIGAGAGMSAAAGAIYGGEWFKENFSEFREKYGEDNPFMQDMYSAGFYPYPDEESYWGYWSKQCILAGIDADHTTLHKVLLDMISSKDIFVLSTNADAQFTKAGLDNDRIFCTQGDYFHIQCAKGCHDKVYDAVELFRKMDEARTDCKVPTNLVPRCPVCKGRMNMDLRIDRYFVQDESWYQAEKRFGDFLTDALKSGERVCLLELGVGFNTPTIIRFPFEKLVRENESCRLIRLNINEAVIPESISDRAVGINADIGKTIWDIANREGGVNG